MGAEQELVLHMEHKLYHLLDMVLKLCLLGQSDQSEELDHMDMELLLLVVVVEDQMEAFVEGVDKTSVVEVI